MLAKETVEAVWWTSQVLWLVVSAVLLVRLKVFDPQTLARAPGRRSNLSLLSVAGVILFYLGTVIATQLVLGLFYRPVARAPAGTAAATEARAAMSQGSTASAPATTAAATSVATEEAATAPAEDPQAAMIFQIADAFTKIFPVLIILALCRRLVVGGIDGWGLSIRKIPGGILYGLLGLLMIYPVLVVINILVSLFIEHFQRRVEETHETLQLLGRHDISSWERVTFVVVAGLFAPVLEEIFFRGLLQTVFMEKGWGFLPYENSVLASPNAGGDFAVLTEPADSSEGEGERVLEYRGGLGAEDHRALTHRWAAILVTSFCFAAIHLMPDSFLVLFALAIGLGYLYERTGNLWACITLHAAFNCLNIYLYTRG